MQLTIAMLVIRKYRTLPLVATALKIKKKQTILLET